MRLHAGMPLSPRPCSICRKWFLPHVRVGARQYACSSPSCQTTRRTKTQAEWRAAHPEYFVAHRLQQRAAGAASQSSAATTPSPPRPPEPQRVPPPLDRLPWDLAQDQFGSQGADFLAVFGRLLVGPAKSQMQAQVVGITAKAGRLPPAARQSQSPAPAS